MGYIKLLKLIKMATPKQKYDQALAAETALKNRYDALVVERASLAITVTNLQNRVNAHVVRPCYNGTTQLRVHPESFKSVTHSRYFTDYECGKLLSAIYGTLQLVLGYLRQPVLNANKEVSDLSVAKARLTAMDVELTDLNENLIPEAEYKTRQAYNEWQQWKFDQLTPEEQQEIIELQSDALNLANKAEVRKWGMYAAVILITVLVLWGFYKFVIKKGA